MSDDLEGHCAGEQGCSLFLTGPPWSHREVEMDFDRAILKLSGSFYGNLRIRLRLAAAYLEDKFPRAYCFLRLPKTYS
jgi:hypothetical protein